MNAALRGPTKAFATARRFLAGDARGTLTALAVLALVGLAFLRYRAQNQAAVAARFRQLGGTVTYSCDLPFASNLWPPRWLASRLSKDFCYNIVGVDMSGTKIDDSVLEELARLTSLRYVSLGNTAIGDAGMRHVSKLKELEELTLRRTNISDASLEFLTGCKNLRLIYLDGTAVSDDGVMQLARLPNLAAIFAVNTRITSEGAELFREVAPSVILQTEKRRRLPRQPGR